MKNFYIFLDIDGVMYDWDWIIAETNAGRMKKPEGVADCFNVDNTAHVEFFLRIESGIITDCKPGRNVIF